MAKLVERGILLRKEGREAVVADRLESSGIRKGKQDAVKNSDGEMLFYVAGEGKVLPSALEATSIRTWRHP